MKKSESGGKCGLEAMEVFIELETPDTNAIVFARIALALALCHGCVRATTRARLPTTS